MYDYVQLFDGENTDARSLGRFCGNQFPEAGIMSSGNDLYVKFATDPADAASGFRLDYVAMETEVQPVSCGGLVTGLAGTITSPGYGPGKKYPDNAKCEWKIDVGRNKVSYLFTHGVKELKELEDTKTYWQRGQGVYVLFFMPSLEREPGFEVPPPSLLKNSKWVRGPILSSDLTG